MCLRVCALGLATFSLIPTLALSQSYGTGINGSVFACKIESYFQTGKGDLSNSASDSCQDGTATASSSASLDLGLKALGSATAGGKDDTPASSGAATSAHQTATLIPPKGFTGTKVPVSFDNDIYAVQISGLAGGGSTAAAGVCWVLPTSSSAPLCKTISTNGSDSGKISAKFVVNKSKSGFKVFILKDATIDIKSNPGNTISAGAATTSVPNLVLPKGWTCKYDSGTSCPK